MDFISNLFWLPTLAIAFALIIWGFQIYRFYLVLVGATIGFLIGIAVGALAFDASISGALVSAALLAVICGYLSWPFYKAIVFVCSGAILGTLAGVLATFFLTQDPQALISIFLTFFLIGGFTALWLLRPVIIFIMGLTGCWTILDYFFRDVAVSLPRVWSFRTATDYLTDYFMRFRGDIVFAVLVVVVWMSFAFIFQITLSTKNRSGRELRRNILVRRSVYFLMIVYLLCVPFYAPPIHEILDMGAANLPAVDYVSVNNLTGLSYSFYPVQAIVLGLLLFWLAENERFGLGLNNPNYLKAYLCTLVIGFLIIPFFTYVQVLAFSQDPTKGLGFWSYFPVIGFPWVFELMYRNPVNIEQGLFFQKPGTFVSIAKFIYLLLVFPLGIRWIVNGISKKRIE